MIDIHHHLLPFIDDGPSGLDQALALARQAVGDGITHIVCTPHRHVSRYGETTAAINAAYQLLLDALRRERIPLKVALAAEIRFGPELMDDVLSDRVPTLGRWEDKPVILLEFPHGELPFGAERLTAWLLQRNIVPMIAHPERNKGILRQPRRLQPFLEQGCLMQLTAAAVSGRLGPACQTLCEQLLRAGGAAVIASDAHDTSHRPAILSEGLHSTARIVGVTAAEKLVYQAPWTIVRSHFE